MLFFVKECSILDLYAKRCWLHTSFFFNARSWVGTDTENRDFFKSCVTKILHDISFLQVCKSRWQNPLFFLGHEIAFLGRSFHESLTDRQCWQESQMGFANFPWYTTMPDENSTLLSEYSSLSNNCAVGINVQVGKFWKINNCADCNKCAGWKIFCSY